MPAGAGATSTLEAPGVVASEAAVNHYRPVAASPRPSSRWPADWECCARPSGAVGQLLPRHHAGAALALHVLGGAVAPAALLPLVRPAAVLQNGQAFHLARGKGGHAALGGAAARGQHPAAKRLQLAVNAADIGDGGVAQIERQARKGGVLLVGLRRDAVGGV